MALKYNFVTDLPSLVIEEDDDHIKKGPVEIGKYLYLHMKFKSFLVHHIALDVQHAMDQVVETGGGSQDQSHNQVQVRVTLVFLPTKSLFKYKSCRDVSLVEQDTYRSG